MNVKSQRRSAIAAAAAAFSEDRALPSALGQLAGEIGAIDGIAGVQILIMSPEPERFQVLGAAGFPRTDDFFERLLECRALGASFEMIRAYDDGVPVVVHDRYAQVMADPAHAPLHDFLRSPIWQDFASIPLILGPDRLGVLNAFSEPGHRIGDEELDFLVAMATHAAHVIDRAQFVDAERVSVSVRERQRLARDLHDAVVQQVFSIGMMAGSLEALIEAGRAQDGQASDIVRDLGATARSVLGDLRAMVDERRPESLPGEDLMGAIADLAEATQARTGIRVTTRVVDPTRTILRAGLERSEDLYRIIAEAVQNAVKHARPTEIGIELASDHGSTLTCSVVDDGLGFAENGGVTNTRTDAGGYGRTSMQHRAERWGGTLAWESTAGGGTRVLLVMPLPESGDGDTDRWVAIR